jgi:hypothetical protein
MFVVSTGVPLVIHYQRLASGKYRACHCQSQMTALSDTTQGLLAHPRQPPPDLSVKSPRVALDGAFHSVMMKRIFFSRKSSNCLQLLILGTTQSS